MDQIERANSMQIFSSELYMDTAFCETMVNLLQSPHSDKFTEPSTQQCPCPTTSIYVQLWIYRDIDQTLNICFTALNIAILYKYQ